MCIESGDLVSVWLCNFQFSCCSGRMSILAAKLEEGDLTGAEVEMSELLEISLIID